MFRHGIKWFTWSYPGSDEKARFASHTAFLSTSTYTLHLTPQLLLHIWMQPSFNTLHLSIGRTPCSRSYGKLTFCLFFSQPLLINHWIYTDKLRRWLLTRQMCLLISKVNFHFITLNILKCWSSPVNWKLTGGLFSHWTVDITLSPPSTVRLHENTSSTNTFSGQSKL